MFCESCGANIDEASGRAGKCSRCGTPLRTSVAPQVGLAPVPGPRRPVSRSTKVIIIGLAAALVITAAVIVAVALFAGKGPADMTTSFLQSVSANRMADADTKWLKSDDFKEFQSDLSDSDFYIREFKVNSVNKMPNEKVVSPKFKQVYFSDEYEPTGDLEDEKYDLDSTASDLDYTKSDLDDEAAYASTLTPEGQAAYNREKAQYDADLKDYNAKLTAWQGKVDADKVQWEARKAAYNKNLAKNTTVCPCVVINTTIYGNSDGESDSKEGKFKLVKYGGSWKILSYETL